MGQLNTPKATAVLGGIVLLILTAVCYLFAISPANGRVADAQAALEAEADAESAAQVSLSRLREAEQNLPKTSEFATQMEAVFPSTAEQPEFFAALEAAAQRAGVGADNITSIAPAAPVQVGDGDDEAAPGEPLDAELAYQDVAITATTTPAQVASLLGFLEEIERAFFLTSFSITLAEETDLSLSGVTFVAPPLPAPPSSSATD